MLFMRQIEASGERARERSLPKHELLIGEVGPQVDLREVGS